MEKQAPPGLTATPDARASSIPHPFQNAKAMAMAVVEAAWSKNAYATKILDVSQVASFTDIFVILSGRSDRHVHAISETIEESMKEKGVRPIGVEGRRAATWILLDFGDVIVHVFEQKTREFYDLERLWSDAVDIPVTEPPWVQEFARMQVGYD